MSKIAGFSRQIITKFPKRPACSVLLLLLSLRVFPPGASIVSGTNQNVSVVTRSSGTDLAGAKCVLTNDKGTWYATTPSSITVHRSFNDLSINCAHDSFESVIQQTKSSTKGIIFGNILFGGPIGVGVDVFTGAGFDYPDTIQVTMGKSVAAVPAVAKVEQQK